MQSSSCHLLSAYCGVVILPVQGTCLPYLNLHVVPSVADAAHAAPVAGCACRLRVQVDGLAAVAAALGCNSQLSRLSLAGSGLSGTALAAMAAAGLAAAAALACLELSVPEAKVGVLGALHCICKCSNACEGNASGVPSCKA